MIGSLAENFKTRFNDFPGHATNIRIFGSPFPIEVSDVPDELKVGLIKLQYASVCSVVSTMKI
jgi:hypothetical protein